MTRGYIRDAVLPANVKQQSFLDEALRRHRLMLGLLGCALAIWLCLPLARMVHVEGFSASIESLAQHLAHDSLAQYDRQFPFNFEYFLTTRMGVVVALASVYRLWPDAGEWAFRIVMLIGLAGLATGSALLVRRWTGVGWLGTLAALLLMPGVTESAFFYNDNVLSSGLAVVALAVLACGSRSSRQWRALLCGVLLAAAIVSRSDAMLLAPAVAGILWLRRAEKIGFVVNLALVAVGMLVVFGTLFAAFRFTLLDSLRIAKYAVGLWRHGESLRSHVITLTWFVGLPALLVIAIGAQRVFVGKAWSLAALIVGMPLLYNLIYLGKAWEVRSLLPTTPFLAALLCVGGRWLIDDATRLHRAGVALLFAIAFIVPANRVDMHDGPREWVGRLWAPILWLAWQDERRLDTDGFDRLARSIEVDRTFITTSWNADRYLHLALQDAGFAPSQVAASDEGAARDCERFVETLHRGTVTVRHLRLHVPFLPLFPSYVPLRFEQFVRDCPSGLVGDPIYLGPSEAVRDAGLGGRSPAFSKGVDTPITFVPPVVTEPNAEAVLDTVGLARLRSLWVGDARRNLADYGPTRPDLMPPRLDQAASLLAPQLKRESIGH